MSQMWLYLRYLIALVGIFGVLILGVLCVQDFPGLSAILVPGSIAGLLGLGQLAADDYLPPQNRPRF